MAFATGARHGLSYVPEVTFGTTPGTPSMKNYRQTGNTLGLQKDGTVSAELRSDRMIPFYRHGRRRVAGNVNVELSYGAFDTVFEHVMFSTWATDVLKIGTTAKFMTLERRFLDIAQYQVLTGCMHNSMAISIPTEGIPTATFGIVGRDLAAASSTLGAPTDVAANEPFDSFSGTISEGGSPIATITALEINLDNGLAPARVVGSALTPQYFFGRAAVTGTLSAYFDSAALLNKFINETPSDLELSLEDPAGNSLTITVPNIKYTGGTADVSSEGGITTSMPWQALLSPSDATCMFFTRDPA